LFTISVLCRAGKVSRSGYYRWLKNKNRVNKDKILQEEIFNLQEKHKYSYGYRKITFTINSKSEKRVNKKKIYRIMRECNLLSVIRRKKKWYGRSECKAKENILNREFISDAPNRKLVTDITEIKLFNRKIYVSAVMDLYNNEIVSHKIGRYNNLGIVTQTISNLIDKRKSLLSGTIFHSDQGFQYTNARTQNKLKEYGMIQSMSRKGNPIDNACIESFFGTLKVETIYNKTLKYKSILHLITELENWIGYYNTTRIQKRLNYLSPKEYKKAM
jgi:putative transposase